MSSSFKRRRRPRNKFFSDGRQAMSATLKKMGLSDSARWLELRERWPKVVGARIAKHTTVVGFQRGVLIVGAHSSPWQQQLRFLLDSLIKKMNQDLEGFHIKEIKVVSYRPQKPPPKTEYLPAVPPNDLHDLKDKLSESVHDDSLRHLIGRAWARSRQAGVEVT